MDRYDIDGFFLKAAEEWTSGSGSSRSACLSVYTSFYVQPTCVEGCDGADVLLPSLPAGDKKLAGDKNNNISSAVSNGRPCTNGRLIRWLAVVPSTPSPFPAVRACTFTCTHAFVFFS